MEGRSHIALLLIASASPIMVGYGSILIFPVLFPAIVDAACHSRIDHAIGSIQRVKRLSDIDLLVVTALLVGLPRFALPLPRDVCQL